MKCHKAYDAKFIKNCEGIPHCECGGIIKPDVVLYEEALDSHIIEEAVRAIQEADVLIVLGTSLVVYPAAGLINYFHGDKLVLINRDMTPYDSKADLLIHNTFDQVFPKLEIPKKNNH